MPNVNTKANVLVRDCFTCRYCGSRLYRAQAIKMLDIHGIGEEHWDTHWKVEPLKSKGATVDHVTPEEEGGYDTLDNLVACCVVCNSSKNKGQRDPLPRSIDNSWDGGACIFLTLAPMYQRHLSKEDKKWLKALKREGIMPDNENIQAKINMLLS